MLLYNKYQSFSNVRETMVLSLVGNKIDLADQRKVSMDEASFYAQSIGAQYYESSALEDQVIIKDFLFFFYYF